MGLSCLAFYIDLARFYILARFLLIIMQLVSLLKYLFADESRGPTPGARASSFLAKDCFPPGPGRPSSGARTAFLQRREAFLQAGTAFCLNP
jgi:hypothetical protein